MTLVKQTELQLFDKDRTTIVIPKNRDGIDFFVILLENIRLESIGEEEKND